MGYTKKQNYYGNCEQNPKLGIGKNHDEVLIGWYIYWGFASPTFGHPTIIFLTLFFQSDYLLINFN
jgi:hypothetical protein